MNVVAAYFDGLDEKISGIERHLAELSAGINELTNFFAAGPAVFRGAVTGGNPEQKSAPEIPAAKSPAPGAAVTGETQAENQAAAVTSGPAPAPAPSPAAAAEKAEKPSEIKAQEEKPVKSKAVESRPPAEIELGALAKQIQAEQAAAIENGTVSPAVEKTHAPAPQAQAERATPARGEAPSEGDLEPLRNRVSALVRGIRPGDADIAQALRERIRTGVLWPVSLCVTWERFDQLKSFLDNAGA